MPLRRLLKRRGHHLGEKAFAAAAAGWGVLVGGTTGAGVILLSLLMATGLEGAAVIATDAAVSIVMGVVKISVFGAAGVLTPNGDRHRAVDRRRRVSRARFLAKLIVERMPVHVHTAMLDAVVIIGGTVMIFGALRY